MRGVWQKVMPVVVALVLLWELGWGAPEMSAQVVTTTVADTVYRADGTPATGSVVVTWNAFTMANGVAVPAGSTTATIGAGGALSIALAPNSGATPMGSYYTAVYHLGDGTVSREYSRWSSAVFVNAPVGS